MKRAKRYPVPEKLLHMPADFHLMVDSIMQKAYNESEDDYNSQASKEPDVPAPCNSQESHEEIDFESSGESEYENAFTNTDTHPDSEVKMEGEEKEDEVVMQTPNVQVNQQQDDKL